MLRRLRRPALALLLNLLSACSHSRSTPPSSPENTPMTRHSFARPAASDASLALAATPSSDFGTEPQPSPSSEPTPSSIVPSPTDESGALRTKLPGGCYPRESPEQARQDLREANEWITRAGEHPMKSDLVQIIPRLQRAAYAGDIEAQTRFGNYVVGYYFTDEMFWPRQSAVAIAALAMLRVAARKTPPQPNNPLMVALSRDPVDLSKLSGVPPLPQAWLKAALAEANRWEQCPESKTPKDEPTSLVTPCPELGERSISTTLVDRRLARVKRGWPAKRVLGVAGKPTACHENKWYYIGGLPTGPEVTYTLTFEKGIVSDISEAGASCKF